MPPQTCTLTIKVLTPWFERIVNPLEPGVFSFLSGCYEDISLITARTAKSKSIHIDFAHYLLNYKERNVPRKKPTTGSNTAVPPKSRKEPRWVNVRLSVEHEMAVEAYTEHSADVVCEFVSWGSLGWSLGVKPATDGKSVMAYAIGWNSDTPDDICGLSAYADTGINAVCCLVYKFEHLLEGEFPAPAVGGTSRFA